MLKLGLSGLSLGQRGGARGPTITTAPVISGDPSVEANTLTLTTAPVWDGAVSSSYVWQLNNGGWSDIALSTDSTTVTVQAGEHIYDYRVVASATNTDGTSTSISNVLEGLDAPVLSNFTDNLDQDPPNALFDSTEAGTLTWDFDAYATPPSKGAGSIGTGTTAVTAGANDVDIDLSAYPDETGYLHLRVTNDAGDSNVLTSQEITTPSGVVNLVLKSQTFTNAVWTYPIATATHSISDPQSGTDAVRVTPTSQYGHIRQLGISYTDGAQYTMSAWVRMASPVALNFNASVTTPSQSFTPTTSWVRYSFTFTATASCDRVQVQNPNAGLQSFEVFGMQLETGGAMNDYVENV